jgi:two-component system sensor histidine kinase ChvG
MAEGQRNQDEDRRRRLSWAILSPILWRIMAVNLLALGVFGAGILYLDQFRDNLMDQHIASLEAQAEIIAAALGESAAAGPESEDLAPLPARQMIQRLAPPTGTRARLFSVDGTLIADSRDMEPARSVYVVPLPPEGERLGLKGRLVAWINRTLDKLASNTSLPLYQERPDQQAIDYTEVVAALAGDAQTRVRRLEDGTLLIAVAEPVQRFRRVLGALMLSADSTGIQAIIEEERLNILQVISIAIAITLLLSVFLAGTIARPIRGLARAADRVKGGIGRSEALHKFSARRDEIGSLSRSLASMTRTLYRQLDAMEQFAADVTHEIKNPLSSLRSAVDTIQRTDDPENQTKLLGIIQDDVRRLDRLISDISDASRLDAELSRSQMEPVDIGILTSTLIDAYRSTIGKREITIDFETPEKAQFVANGIEGRLGQVLRNIIDNALSFTPKGGEIGVYLFEKKNCLLILVEDEGPGLPEGAETRIFERFYSERPSRELFGRHSGLGLSISRQIVEAHGGRIEARNRGDSDQVISEEARSGAQFRIELPLE